MASALSENSLRCIAGIHEAFADCPKPLLENLVPDSGMEEPYVKLNWGHLESADVEDLDFFSGTLAEDLSSMSSVALLYFLPSVMVLFLKRPDSVDFSGFIRIISYFENLWGWLENGKNRTDEVFSAAQADAIRNWFEQLLNNLSPFDLGSSEAEYVKRLQRLKSGGPALLITNNQ